MTTEQNPAPQAADAVREALEEANEGFLEIGAHLSQPNRSFDYIAGIAAKGRKKLRAALSTAGGEWRTMVELHKFVTDHFANQDMNHLDFRVEAYRIIATHAPVSGEIVDQSDSSGTLRSPSRSTVEER